MSTNAWIEEGRTVARQMGTRIQLTVPSIQAAGERFALRITAFDADGLPGGTFAGQLEFDGCRGINGLPGRFELMRNGAEIQSIKYGADSDILDLVFSDEDNVDDVAVRGARHHAEPFVVYYVRVETGGRQTMWTSPIWVDF